MKSMVELENLANIAAEQYLKNNVALNDSIVKIAKDNALNHEQINRVVEAANTNVYVKLFNESSNKYIEFPNADSEKIASIINPPRDNSMNISDYQHEPQKQVLDNVKIFPETKDPEVNKEAMFLDNFYKLASTQERINNAIAEVEAGFEAEFSNFCGMVKQAVLRGTTFEEIQSAITHILPDPFIKVAMKNVYKVLVENEVIKNAGTFTKVGSVNTKHPLVKKAEDLLEFKNTMIVLQDKAEQNINQYELFKKATDGSIFQTLMAHPKLLGGAFIGGAAAGILGYKKYKKVRDAQANSPLIATPDNYKRNV
jgi:hypothetical protein